MDFMKHYPYASEEDAMALLNSYPHATRRDMENLFIIYDSTMARCLHPPNILTLIEDSIHGISISRETEKQKGRKHVIAGPLLHVHSLHVQPTEALEGRPLLVCGTIRVKYLNIITGKEVQLDVYRRSAEDADYISPSGGDLVLFGTDIFHAGITGYQDFWMELQGTTIEVDLYLKLGKSTRSFAREKFLVGSTTEGDVEELRSKEFQHPLCSATLSYIKMPFAALCGVEVRFSSKNKGLVVNIAGKIVARYKNICGNYNSEPCVLFEKQNGFESVRMQEIMCMSRILLGLPAYSSLEVELDLVDVNTNKHINKQIKLLNEDNPYAGDFAVDVDGDFAIIFDVELIPYVQRGSVHRNESDDGWSLSNNPSPRYDLDPESMLIPSSFAEFYSIFIGRKKTGSALKIFGTVELSSFEKTNYLFKRTCDDGVEIEDSQKVLPLGDVHRSLDHYSMLELKVDLKDAGGKFQSRGFARRDRLFDTQICSVFPGEEGFCALHYSIFSSALLAKIEIIVKNKGDHFGPDIVYGSAIACYSFFEYPTEFERNYFRIVLFKRTEKDSVQLKDDGRVPLSRCVVAVPMGSSLIIHVDLFGTRYHLSCNEVFKIGSSSFNKPENDHDLDIKLTWSDGFHNGGNDSNIDKDCRMGGVNQTKTREQPSHQLNGGSDLDEDEDCRMGVVEQTKTSAKRKQPDHHKEWSDLEKGEE